MPRFLNSVALSCYLRICIFTSPQSLLLLLVARVIASRLFRQAGALAAQALRAHRPNGVAVVHSMASGGGVLTDDDQATGLEREVMMAARKGQDPYNMLAPKAAAGTKEDPHLVPSINNKRIVGCICEEDSNVVIWFWLRKGDAQRYPNCWTHYKLVPHQLAH
ncbi:PREDICTED: cytochrome c oxidase subunit 5B, mitochondrial-like [Elephantulus edwardii]|uniref:cytochrome c oxidase subunit 5B, mitochondrial-like n=1 Tax=Elephantulus edwardii TaxID=28737 RepID=UPI0003F060EF|nr:PREDICTED: cytochrome c oxidase subunit 5B, mitochondrial-like [Elephantulus edwardii]